MLLLHEINHIIILNVYLIRIYLVQENLPHVTMLREKRKGKTLDSLELCICVRGRWWVSWGCKSDRLNNHCLRLPDAVLTKT
jgi:hypothetical protein